MYEFKTYEEYMEWKDKECLESKSREICVKCGEKLELNPISMMIPIKIGNYKTFDSLTVFEPRPHECKALNNLGE